MALTRAFASQYVLAGNVANICIMANLSKVVYMMVRVCLLHYSLRPFDNWQCLGKMLALTISSISAIIQLYFT
jgi:hypothetical protein